MREEVLAESSLPGALFPVPEKCASDGCGWPSVHSFVVPEGWRSGLYEVTMRVRCVRACVRACVRVGVSLFLKFAHSLIHCARLSLFVRACVWWLQ